jgi:hypothetical protein
VPGSGSTTALGSVKDHFLAWYYTLTRATYATGIRHLVPHCSEGIEKSSAWIRIENCSRESKRPLFGMQLGHMFNSVRKKPLGIMSTGNSSGLGEYLSHAGCSNTADKVQEMTINNLHQLPI